MPRSKKTSSGGSGATGGTTQNCIQEGTFIVIANLVGTTTRPFPNGMDVSVVEAVRASGGGGKSGKTDGNGLKEFPGLPCTMHTATASLTGGNASKFELVGSRRATSSVPAGGSTIVNFDIVPLLAIKVRVKVKDSSPPVFLKPERITLTEAKGRFETSHTGDGTWEFKKLHPGQVTLEVRLTPQDREKYELSEVTSSRQLTETPQPNVIELEAKRLPVLVPLYFSFRFLDPEAKPRTLPGRFPVKVKLSEPIPIKPGDAPAGPDTYDAEINANGLLTPVGGAAPLRVSRAYKKLALDLTQAEAHFVVCEAAGEAAQTAETLKYEDTDAFRARLRAGRSFMLPWKQTWNLETSDWDIKDGSADAKPRFAQLSTESVLFGTPAQMLTFTLKPRWQFTRFTFFDRQFGFSNHAKAPVSIPPVLLRAYRVMPGKAKVAEAEAAAADAAAKAAVLAEKRDALHLAQDRLDEIDNDVAFKEYLKNWYEANRPATDAKRIEKVNEYNTAVAPRAAAVTALANAQAAFDPVQAPASAAATIAAAKLEAAREEWKKASADTCSTWVHLPASGADGAVQCLPWLLNKKPDGSPDAGLDADVVLEFKTAKDTYIESTSATERALVKVPAGDKRLEPSADRMKIYDMPLVWRSRRYFARLGAKANRFEQLVDKPTSLTEPLTFCLDDLVLCLRSHHLGSDLKLRVLSDKEWAPDKRCTLFHHRFKDTAIDGSALADVSKQGVYKPDTAGKKSYFSLLPTGTAAGTAGDSTVEKDRNYIADYPHWTRLVLAQGNVYDVFDRRTPESPIGVTGARAAVCWRDVTSEMAGIEMVHNRWIPSSPTDGAFADTAARNNRPSPSKQFKVRPSAWSGGRYFHLQPYVENEYYSRSERFDPSKSFGIGRVDYALIRCCGRVGEGAAAKEHAVNLHFTRNFFQFTPNAATALASVGLTEDEWKDAWSANCINRWNGNDPGKNIHRAKLLPGTLPDGTAASLKLECEVLWFMHVTNRLQAQFLVNVQDRGANARDNRGGVAGTGESSPAGYKDGATTGEDYSGATVNTGWYPSAHESGHADALPDEYNERWDGASHGQMSFKSNLPGDPFEPDGRVVSWATNGSPMMNGNQLLRNRYFWISAEWVRLRIESTASPTPIKVAFTSPDGTVYDKFQIPSHPSEKRTYLYWPIRHSIDHAAPAARGKRNFFLYPLGHEEWTVRDAYARQTPAAAPDPANPYDGICVVTFNLEALLPSWPLGAAADAPTTATQRQEMLQAITRVVLKEFNFKWYLTGKVIEGTATWTFRRCLIFFSFRYLDGRDAEAGGIRTAFGSQFVLNTTHAATGPSDGWHAALGSADSERYNVTMNFGNALAATNLATKVRNAFPAMLGVNKAWNAIQPADLQPFFAPINLQALLIHAV